MRLLQRAEPNLQTRFRPAGISLILATDTPNSPPQKFRRVLIADKSEVERQGQRLLAQLPQQLLRIKPIRYGWIKRAHASILKFTVNRWNLQASRRTK